MQTLKLKHITVEFEIEPAGEYEFIFKLKILEMDSRFRSDGKAMNSYHSPANRFDIHSSAGPELRLNSMYLYGCFTMNDTDVSAMRFKNSSSMTAYVDRVFSALEEWDTKWSGFIESVDDSKMWEAFD